MSDTTRTVGIEDAEITVSDTGLIVTDLGGHRYRGNSVEALALLDALQANEQQLRDAARVAEQRQRWDDAYQIARDVLGQGARVLRIEPGYAPADNEHGTDYTRPVIDIVLMDSAFIGRYAQDLATTRTRGNYVTTTAEVVLGVVLTSTDRIETPGEVA